MLDTLPMNYRNQPEFAANSARAAQMLMSARLQCNLRHQDVAAATRRIARQLGPAFAISTYRLADIESGRVRPTMWRLSSLCAVYGIEMSQVLQWYGVQHAGLASATAA